jgi:hypothetical protein
MPSCSSGVIFIPLTVVRVTVVLKERFLGWRSNYEGRLKSSWTGGSAPPLCCYASLCITAAHAASPRTSQTDLVHYPSARQRTHIEDFSCYKQNQFRKHLNSLHVDGADQEIFIFALHASVIGKRFGKSTPLLVRAKSYIIARL